ncbi:MAG: DNA polymerase III subunit chi [Pseudomonadota bacterium]|nr:DNA polymerase III subunit chi [Pseudomonadales bacterium]MDY6920555.1 DNA polymerase III subunit chi [Pseudomonadota bacterium]
MTRVDFYILPADQRLSPIDYTARLVEKAFRRGHEIFVFTRDTGQTEALSAALWQRPDSFLAHGCGPGQGHQPLQLCHQEQPGQHEDVMVNLATNIPPFFSRFHRVAEIVPGDPESRARCRDKFRFYRERGYALDTHNI